MSAMKKEAVGARTGGFMQTRRGTRPLHVETLLRRKGHDSAANVFEPAAPTATDKTFEQSLAATAGDEFQPDVQGPEKEAELRRDTVDEKPTPVSPELIESVKIRGVGEKDGKQVFLVDGGKVRDKIDVDFALGGNSARYSYVPEGELWVENTGSKKDVANTTIHEDREEGLMRRGQTYDQAHDTASKEEEGRRKEAQHRERVEVFALKDGKIIGGRYPDESFGVYGGGIDPGESAYKAARREFAEEAGYKLRRLRHAKETPFASPWASGEQKGLAFPEKVRQRMEQFPSGHRTTYLVGEVGRTTPVSDTPTQLRDIRPYDISEAIKYQTGALAKATGDDAQRIRSRLGVLHELQRLNIQKTGAAEFAPGIPVGRVVKRVPSVKESGPNAEWTASLSLHPAARRGDHFDLRLVDPKGQAHSWAINKMPDPGGSTYAAQQPTHTGRYAKRTEPFTIPLNVYGGTRPGAQVEPKYVQPVEIISANDKRVHLLRHQGQETEELVLRRVAKAGDRTPIWALHNATKTRSTQEGQRLPDAKPKYQDVPIGSVDLNNDQQLMTAKIDGAHTIVDFPKADRMVRTYSYRPTQRQSGVIEHTFKFPNFQNLKTPKSLKGTIIRAETWASDPSGKAIPASEIGGLLNSNVNRSRQLQQEQGITLRRTGIDVVKFKGKDMSSAPFAEKLKVLEQVHKATGGAIELPLAARTPEEKATLLNAVKARKLPETKEGVVLHDLSSSSMMKAKVRPDTDVYVREVFTKPKTEAKGQAAGFKYSLEPTGPIVGRVGTGLSTSLRKEMLENPDQFVGRVAKVQSGGQHVSRSGKAGALIGSPAFKEWHINKTPPELMKSAESPSRWRGISEAVRDASEEADPEKLVDRLTAGTRQGRALKPVLESSQVRPYVLRLRRAYHRIMKDKSSA